MSANPDARDAAKDDYIVVARRYRPQSFQELVGQQQVSQALANAITTHRIGHAYLFTGARGVGKTSMARIFAKALNCVEGPTVQSCNRCDICAGITSGGDVDVLEIDGASNRGIDEIRQLRSNVSIRPSRARFKIYIIDEVHMLTTPAFNALLKTLEEPPEHVKFVFCTTDPEKIPITVLSRCQRFDFAPIGIEAITARLRDIVSQEKMSADEEALQFLARQAGGSMRDSQSLLEQLLAYCEAQITLADVHAMLGTAQARQLSALTTRLVAGDAAAALGELDNAVTQGVEVGQLAEQLAGYYRDMMAASVGCDAPLMLQTAASDLPALRSDGQQLGVETILATLQILDQAITRMRQSSQARLLLEVAIVRVCHLDRLDELSSALAELRGLPEAADQPPQSRRSDASRAVAGRPSAQKKTELGTASSPDRPTECPAADLSGSLSAEEIWTQTLSNFEDITADYGSFYERVASPAPNRLVVSFKSGYTLQKEGCERPERKARIEEVLQRITGRSMRVDFEVLADRQSAAVVTQRPPSLRQRIRETEKHPFVRRAVELFDAEVTRLEEPRPER